MSKVLSVSCRYPNAEEQQAKKKQLAELQQLRSDMLLSQPFVAVLAMRLQLVVVADDRMPTACTDSHHIFFNLDFMAECTAAQKRFVLAHEVWHCVMGHFLRQQNREPRRWNYACDFEVNAILLHFFKHEDIPDNVLCSERLIGKSAEQIYTILGKTAEQDWYSTPFWQTNVLPGAEAQFDQHQPELCAEAAAGIRIDPEFQPKASSEQDVSRWRDYTAAAVQHTGVIAGSQSAGLQRVIDNVFTPQLSWPALLQRFIQRSTGGSYSWHRPARRALAQGLYLPGRQSKKLSISLAVDTSGSTVADLPQFLAEITSILQNFEQVRLQVISCDMQITNVSYYERSDLHQLSSWQANGFGGTDFRPVFQYLASGESEQDLPQVLLFFTDGYGDVPTEVPPYPVIWVLTSNGDTPANWGDVIQLN